MRNTKADALLEALPYFQQFRGRIVVVKYGGAAMENPDLVESVMRDLLSPYRREDADEVMQIVRNNGGIERIHLAFYRDNKMNDNERWHFWRLEAPGFVWNFRVLPHVHCYVNIAATMMG